MSQALYRKYRSTSLDEIVGQTAVVTSLKNALKTNQISHAYLFTGPRGVGKTSIARILAFEINNIPYNSDNLPLDIIEIDAASNRRIDEIRDLREKVRIAPTVAKYKIYIIDEVHMLTKEAFNALLKTLEEPPAHVIFILATTEAHKIPETIISRTERYHFRLAEPAQVTEHLVKIAKKENIDIDKDAVETLAVHSGGSLRDALSLMDQVRHNGGKKITKKYIEATLGLPSSELVESIVNNIQVTNSAELLTNLKIASENGISPNLLAESLSAYLRTQITKNNPILPKKDTLSLLRNLLLVETSGRPDAYLEISLLQSIIDIEANQFPVHTVAHAVIPPLTVSKPAAQVKKEFVLNEKQESKVPKDINFEVTAEINSSKSEMTINKWQAILEDLRSSHNTLYSVLRMAKLKQDKFSDKIVELEFSFPFHQKRISDNRNKKIIQDAMERAGITEHELVCMTVSTEKNSPKFSKGVTTNESKVSDENSSNALLSQVKNIFGGAEVLE